MILERIQCIQFLHTFNLILYFCVDRLILRRAGGGALNTCTYGEVSSIFFCQNIAKSDIFGSK